MIPKPHHACTVEIVANSKLPVRWGVEIGVGNGVVEQLLVDAWAAAKFCQKGHHGGHVSANTVADNS